MDRSFLSDDQVVKASRDFVCIRLATYEDGDEAEFLRKVYGRELANTVFTILSPDGEPVLRPARGPRFRHASDLAKKMNSIFRQRAVRQNGGEWVPSILPELKSLDLAINVAACDGLPIAVVIGTDQAEVESYRKKLNAIAWEEPLVGQLIYASVKADDDLRPLSGLPDNPRGVFIAEPDSYGLSAKVMYSIDSDSVSRIDSSPSKKELAALIADFKPPVKEHRSHTLQGVRFGFRWATEVPVTDQQSVKATKRAWGE